jgi:hypothetical protein
MNNSAKLKNPASTTMYYYFENKSEKSETQATKIF